MGGIFTPAMSDFFERYYRERGGDLQPRSFQGVGQRRPRGARGPGDRARRRTELMVAGVGVTPNVDLARDTPLHLDDGIVVNRFLETNVRRLCCGRCGALSAIRHGRTGGASNTGTTPKPKPNTRPACSACAGSIATCPILPRTSSISYEFWGEDQPCRHHCAPGQL
ncbi:MAG: hypothetical protein R2851_07275 [Caldilineaceae bacterium]